MTTDQFGQTPAPLPSVAVVVTEEGDDGPIVLGTYSRTVEDAVHYYYGPDEEESWAPWDCVRVVTVPIPGRLPASVDVPLRAAAGLMAEALTAHVRTAWELERDRHDAESRLPNPGALRAEVIMLNERMERLTKTVAGLMADAGQHSVRVEP